MNGATSKSFMKNLSGSDFTSHRNKKRFFEAADVNKAVGMQTGKHLFTTQHHLSPSPAVDQVTPAHSNGRGVKTDIYSMQQGKNTPRPINNLTAEENTARTNVIMNSRVRSDGTSGNKPVIKPGSGHGGGRVLTESNDNISNWINSLARKEGTALEESSNSEEDDTTKDKKEKVNLNIQPGKATIVALQRGRHKY